MFCASSFLAGGVQEVERMVDLPSVHSSLCEQVEAKIVLEERRTRWSQRDGMKGRDTVFFLGCCPLPTPIKSGFGWCSLYS